MRKLNGKCVISGTYALHFYDTSALIDKPPTLLIACDSDDVAESIRAVLERALRACDTKPIVIKRKEINIEPNPPHELENVPVAPLRDALLDALEMCWCGEEECVQALAQLITYSSKLSDYEELVMKAQEYCYMNALKLINIAANYLAEFTDSKFYEEIAELTRRELKRDVDLSEASCNVLDSIRYALSEVLGEYVYIELVSRKKKITRLDEYVIKYCKSSF